MSKLDQKSYQVFLRRYLSITQSFAAEVRASVWDNLAAFEKERETLINAIEAAKGQAAGLSQAEAAERAELIQQILQLDEEIFEHLEAQLGSVRTEISKARRAQNQVSKFRDGAGSGGPATMGIEEEI